jgi:hypothetical protein
VYAPSSNNEPQIENSLRLEIKSKKDSKLTEIDRPYARLSDSAWKRIGLVFQATLQDLQIKKPAARKRSKPTERHVPREWVN